MSGDTTERDCRRRAPRVLVPSPRGGSGLEAPKHSARGAGRGPDVRSPRPDVPPPRRAPWLDLPELSAAPVAGPGLLAALGASA